MKVRAIQTFLTQALVVFLCCHPLHAQIEPDAEYARAENLVRNHQWDDGLALLTQYLKNAPRDVKALNLSGIASAGKGNSQEAISYFRRALDVDPNFLPSLKNLAIGESNAHEFGAAEKHLLAAQRILPADPTVNLYLGEIAYRRQNFKLAAEDLERAGESIFHHPDVAASFTVSLLRIGQEQKGLEVLNQISPAEISRQSQLEVGVALEEDDEDAKAVPYLQAAFKGDPNSYNTGFDLALACLRSKDYAMVVETGETLIRNGQDTSELENMVADALAASGHAQSAADSYKKAIALNPEDESNYLDFTALCIEHRAFEDGMKVITLGLRMSPKSERLTFMRGVLEASEDRFDLAEKDFQEAALLAPQHDYGAVGLGAMYLERGRSDETIKVIRERLRQNPEDASLLYLLGTGIIASGAGPGTPAYAEAQEDLEKSIRLNSELCLPHISLGSIYLSEGRYSDAAAQFEAARTIDPNENSAYSHLAVAYRHLGQPEKAREVLAALQQVLEQQRNGTRAKQTPVKE